MFFGRNQVRTGIVRRFPFKKRYEKGFFQSIESPAFSVNDSEAAYQRELLLHNLLYPLTSQLCHAIESDYK